MAERATDTIEPRSRAHVVWTPDLIRAAESIAESGCLRVAADLCEEMFADDRIKAVLDTRTDTLLGLPILFEGRSKRAVKALEAKEDYWSIFDDSECKRLHTWGLMLGVGIARKVWTVNEEGRDIPRLVTKSPRSLEFDHDKQQWIFVDREGTRHLVTPGDDRWVLYTPYGIARPWAFGAWRALSRWHFLKMCARSDWALHSETKGQGILAATKLKGTIDQRREIANDLRKMGRRAVIPLPDDMDLKLIESVAKSWDSFDAQIKVSDNAYGITILGQNLTTQAGATGNQGAAAIHKDVALGKTKSDNETWSTMAHDQVLTGWAESNFGSRSAAPWPLRDTSTLEDKRGAAGVEQMTSQATATLKQAGIITKNEGRKRHGYAPVPGGDTFETSPTPAATPTTKPAPEPDPDPDPDPKDKDEGDDDA